MGDDDGKKTSSDHMAPRTAITSTNRTQDHKLYNPLS